MSRREAILRLRGQGSGAGRGSGVAVLLRSRALWGTMLAQGCLVYAYQMLLTWLPSYLQRSRGIAVFRETDGYPLPPPDHADTLLGTAILLALHQQSAGTDCRALGEKNPENVFLYPRLRQLFPTARLICIARDPRDVLASDWHFFHRPATRASQTAVEETAAKTAFLHGALPALVHGARSMLALAERHPQGCVIVTYEALLHDPAPHLAALFRLLGVSDAPAVVQACLDRTSFAALTGGRPAGVAQDGAFLRKGVAGDWRATLTPAMGELVLQELGWMFPRFGWIP